MLNNPMGNMSGFLQKLNELKSTGGDPNQRIQQLMNSGRITQADYDRAVQMAQQLRKMLGM